MDRTQKDPSDSCTGTVQPILEHLEVETPQSKMTGAGRFRNLQYRLRLPFLNLTPQQHVLQILRFSTSFIAFCLLITVLLINGSPTFSYVARINSAHLDVSLGLYKSLRTSMSSADTNYRNQNEILPTDLSLSDSEISILTRYTENQVAGAPQYILLGVAEYCEVSYNSYQDDADEDSTEPPSTLRVCQEYQGTTNLFDYRTLLLEAGLTIIMAYAYKSDYENDNAYQVRVAQRRKRFDIIAVVTVFEMCTQFVMMVYGFVVYSNRGTAKDLSRIPRLTMNIFAVIAVAGGLAMTAGAVVVTRLMIDMRNDVSDGLKVFGITLVLGKTYFYLIWATFSFSFLSMLSWVVPLWCSNPPSDGYVSDEETYYNRSDLSQPASDFVLRPYQVSRQTKQKKTTRSASRLFDETITSVSVNQVDARLLSSIAEEEPSFNEEIQNYNTEESDFGTIESSARELSSRSHSERELRKLGETITRKFSVRHLNRPKTTTNLDWLPEEDETHHLLYGDNPFSSHQYPQAYPKTTTSETGEFSRGTTLNKGNRSSSRNITLEERRTVKGSDNGLVVNRDNAVRDGNDGASVLDEQEMSYLDSSKFVNRIA